MAGNMRDTVEPYAQRRIVSLQSQWTQERSASWIKLLMKQVLESPNKNERIATFFPKNDDKEYQDLSENFKNIIQVQGNIEAHEMFMITDAIQGQTCYHNTTLGHTCCTCGQASSGASK